MERELHSYSLSRVGAEAAEDARVWHIYKKRATERSENRMKKLKATIDSLPVFAGLFSAVSTAFIIEGYKSLQPDYTEYMSKAFFAIHSQNAAPSLDKSFNPDAFEAPQLARWWNGLWLASLILSLFVALNAIVAQQWLEEFTSRITAPAESHRHWARRHRAFSTGLDKWKIDFFISSLPLLLHVSLLLFSTGLVLFFWQLDKIVAGVLMALAALATAFYLTTTIAPLKWPEAPTATPLLRFIRYAWSS
ncbi:hypothetical protein BKA62DRAFT_622995, partial [Auriculariales sp. MPI-PUGE-AT-0066]